MRLGFGVLVGLFVRLGETGPFPNSCGCVTGEVDGGDEAAGRRESSINTAGRFATRLAMSEGWARQNSDEPERGGNSRALQQRP